MKRKGVQDNPGVRKAEAAVGSGEASVGWSLESLGLKIKWQEGPLGRGADRKEPNGTTVEEVITAAKERLKFHEADQDKKFSCFENQMAIAALEKGLAYLANRTKSREERGVEGTNQI